MIERIICAVAGHKMQTSRVFSPHARQICCMRCHKLWGMNDDVRAIIPWDSDLENLYKTIGQWKEGIK